MKIKLTPITRLSMTLDSEMSIDRDSLIFDEHRYSRYLTKYDDAVNQRNNIMKSVILSDILILVLISGTSVTIPDLGINLSQLPGAFPVLLIISSSAFMTFALAFLNEQSYLSIVSQFHIRICRKLGVDPDFSIAADVFQQMFVKLYRSKFNIWGFDIFEVGQTYRRFFKSLGIAIGAVYAGLFSLHFLILILGIVTYFHQSNSIFASILLSTLSIFINAVGLVVFFSLSLSFEFESQSTEPTSTASPPSAIMPEPEVTSLGQ